ncbi:MAG: CinA family nicotinamide mononucleotide deamidase-related protein [Chloroflexota bacterium]
MKAEIISIGTELLLGTITDTNASYLAQRLADLGIDCYYISQVGDNPGRIVEVLERAWHRSDLTITTGGLGPTGDDLTRESIAAMLGESLYVVPELEEHLRSFFARRGMTMPDRNLKQATLIPSAETLSNPVGSAPGWFVHRSEPGTGPMIVSMPGVPYEMKRMWEQEVEPRLSPLSPTVLVSRTLKILGLGESAIDEMMSDLMNGSNPTLAPYAKQDGVHLRISAKADTATNAWHMIAPMEAAVRTRLGDAIYGIDDDTPGSIVQGLLADRRVMVATLEVGAGAIGSLTPQLAGQDSLVAGLEFYDMEHASRYLGAAGSLELADAALVVLRQSGAEIAVGIQVNLSDAATGSVKSDTEVILVSEVGGTSSVVRMKSSWTTSRGEVQRLAGLAALNALRKWLVEHKELIGRADG